MGLTMNGLGRNATVSTPDPAGRILVADNEPSVRKVLRRWLLAAGYKCEAAASAAQALLLLNRKPFSLLLITDVGMTNTTGINLLEMVRRRDPDLAVVILTTTDDQEPTTRALELGAYGCALRPFEKNEILDQVASALRAREPGNREHEHPAGKWTVFDRMADGRTSPEEVVCRLVAAQESCPGETGPHIRRVSLFAEEISRRIGYAPAQRNMLRLAASLHDIGKIAVPTSILLKRGPLSPSEWETLKSHTAIGERILGGTDMPVLVAAGEIALHHHERWDGRGYPCGLQETGVPESARIVAVADAYDALVHDRVYRPAVSHEAAVQLMSRERAGQFDPEIFSAFVESLPQIRRIEGKAGFREAAINAVQSPGIPACA